jgi:hypothetical protein
MLSIKSLSILKTTENNYGTMSGWTHTHPFSKRLHIFHFLDNPGRFLQKGENFHIEFPK